MNHTLVHGGLVKLTEECGELSQVAMKKVQFPSLGVNQSHSDNQGPLNVRIEYEIADVLAAIEYVVAHHKLDRRLIAIRMQEKLERFAKWEVEKV